MDGDVVLGILVLVALSMAGAVSLRLLLRSPAAINWLLDDAIPSVRRRRARLPEPSGRPIEEIASSIRRLGTAFHGAGPGRSFVKTEAFRRAYEQALVEGCRALDVSTDLLDIDLGTEHDAERLRVEYLLTDAGLILPRAA
jgi:pimeloyl-ACP methyl ester carboxylesterase